MLVQAWGNHDSERFHKNARSFGEKFALDLSFKVDDDLQEEEGLTDRDWYDFDDKTNENFMHGKKAESFEMLVLLSAVVTILWDLKTTRYVFYFTISSSINMYHSEDEKRIY